MALGHGETRMEVVACLASIYQGGADLPDYGPEPEKERLTSLINNISEIEEGERIQYIADRLKTLVAKERFTCLSEIHPAWLVEVLSKESPRIIGIILRYLPSKHVRYILENLPKRIRHRLPQLIDAFAVPNEILEIIRLRFEKQFVSITGPRELDGFDFDKVGYLNGEDINVLIRDLGIHELAMALKGVDRRSLNILFNRLTIDEARTLQQRIRSLVDVPPQLLRDAKYTVLEMSISETDSNSLLMDIGLNAFARAIGESANVLYPLIKQKLEPRLGYSLKRYIDQHAGTNFPEIVNKRRDLIMKRVEALSRAGSIDEEIARYFDHPEVSTGAEDVAEGQIAHQTGIEAESWQTENGVVS